MKFKKKNRPEPSKPLKALVGSKGFYFISDRGDVTFLGSSGEITLTVAPSLDTILDIEGNKVTPLYAGDTLEIEYN